MTRDSPPVKSLHTSIQIVEILEELQSGGVTEIAEKLNIPQSTVFNHLKTLEAEEYVINEGGSYRISPKFLKVGARAREYYDIYDVAQDEVERLAKETGEISGLIIEEHGFGIFLHRQEGSNAVSVDSYVGQRIYLHGAALGKAILAFLPADQRESIIRDKGLPKLAENTITNRDVLSMELDQVREDKIAYDNQERLEGLRSVAVPLTNKDGRVLGSLSVAGPASRLQDERLHGDLADKVREAADIIELNIAYA